MSGMRKVAIRVDANDTIAMGHMVRCIAIAVQLRAMGYDVTFILSEEYASDLVREHGFSVICLHNRYCEKELEIGHILNLLEAQEMDTLLLDSYQATYRYMDSLKKHVRLVYLDDLNLFRYPADVIINYAPDADINVYQDRGYRGVQFLLGSRYAPLRQEFCCAPITVRENPERIFLATGGTDGYDMICGILEAVLHAPCSDMKKSVVTGKFYSHEKTLESICAMDPLTDVYHDISEIGQVMRQCDIAISAGGTTLAELCACGLPVIGFSVADNQLAGIRAYANAKALIYAGDVRADRERVVENIVHNVRRLRENFSERRALATRAHQMVDGYGACRIANFFAENRF